MDAELAARRERLTRRCRIWFFCGYGLLLAGMAMLFTAHRGIAWGLLMTGAACRVMHYLDHLALRSLHRLAYLDGLQQHRRELDAPSPPAGNERAGD